MRVALFTDTFSPQINGVAKTYQRLIDYLQTRNVETIVFAPSGSGQNPYETDRGNVIRFLSWDFFLYPECRMSLPNYFTVQSMLDEFKPDLIHLATPFSLGLAGLKYAKSHMIPKVAVFHTNIPQYLEYYHLPWLKKLSWRYMRWFHKQADKNYCPSHDTMRLLHRHGIGNLELWTRGVDHQAFNAGWRSTELRHQYNLDDKIMLLYVGRLAPEKNLNILMQALKTANRDSDNLHLLVVGDGPSRAELETIAPENVSFLGYRTGVELSTIYATADMFVCPSVTETFGNVILEAMASSLPVIAPLVGGIKENLIDNITGLSCMPHSPLSMGRAINRLAKDNTLRIELASRAYDHASTQSWDQIFGRLLNSYQKVVERAKDHKIKHAV